MQHELGKQLEGYQNATRQVIEFYKELKDSVLVRRQPVMSRDTKTISKFDVYDGS